MIREYVSFSGNTLLDERTWIAPYISTVLIATTIHMQDFRDEAGDRLQGRITFPVVMPVFSRRMTAVLLVVWSVGLAAYWNLDRIIASSYVALGLYIAMRVLQQRTEAEDKVSLRIYMVSDTLTLLLVSPVLLIATAVLAFRWTDFTVLD